MYIASRMSRHTLGTICHLAIKPLKDFLPNCRVRIGEDNAGAAIFVSPCECAHDLKLLHHTWQKQLQTQHAAVGQRHADTFKPHTAVPEIRG